ncbi:MAG: 50S ribosomal protein L4 [Patescibacteria group bacterium]
MATTKKTTEKKVVTKKEKVAKAPKAVDVLEAKIYAIDGKSSGTVSLPPEIFGLNWNADLVHQVVTSMRTDARTPVAHAKDRGDIRGGGKKPWKQKGTGRARHGSSRSPIWVGGGVAHGPTNETNFTRKINKKAKVKAVFTILSRKFRDGEVIFVKDLALANPKTVDAKAALTKIASGSGIEMLAQRRNNAAFILSPKIETNAKRGFQNMSNLEVNELRNINPLALLQYKYVVIASPEESIEMLKAKMN